MNSSAPHEITFRPVEERDFPLLTDWLAEPHVRGFYQKTSVSLEEVASEYGPSRSRGRTDPLPPRDHRGHAVRLPAVLPQCRLSGVDGHDRGGRRNKRGPLHWRVDVPPQRVRARVAELVCSRSLFHITAGKGAPTSPTSSVTRRRSDCSRAVGFRPLRAFLEDGCEMLLLATDRNSLLQHRPMAGREVNEVNML